MRKHLHAIYGARGLNGEVETVYEEQQLPEEDASAVDLFLALRAMRVYYWLELFCDRELVDSYHAIGVAFDGRYIYEHEIKSDYLSELLAKGGHK